VNKPPTLKEGKKKGRLEKETRNGRGATSRNKTPTLLDYIRPAGVSAFAMPETVLSKTR